MAERERSAEQSSRRPAQGQFSGASLVLAAGMEARLCPRGTSMAPLVCSGDPVALRPVDPSKLERGDVVLVDVGARTYLHFVLSTDRAKRRVLVGNARGSVNGWTSWDSVRGICTEVRGRTKRAALEKSLPLRDPLERGASSGDASPGESPGDEQSRASGKTVPRGQG